ncbi:hypothetical protein FHG87_010477 [Trinorchestia longiramus]|nr:hypothetical protein FHG87_010477 [Trinorchestia longiramus]
MLTMVYKVTNNTFEGVVVNHNGSKSSDEVRFPLQTEAPVDQRAVCCSGSSAQLTAQYKETATLCFTDSPPSTSKVNISTKNSQNTANSRANEEEISHLLCEQDGAQSTHPLTRCALAPTRHALQLFTSWTRYSIIAPPSSGNWVGQITKVTQRRASSSTAPRQPSYNAPKLPSVTST